MQDLAKAERGYHHGSLRKAILAHAQAAYAEGRVWSMACAARDLGVTSGAPYRHFAKAAHVPLEVARLGRQRLADLVSGLASPLQVARATLEFAAGDGRAAFRLGIEPIGLEGTTHLLVYAMARRVAEGEPLEAAWEAIQPAVR